MNWSHQNFQCVAGLLGVAFVLITGGGCSSVSDDIEFRDAWIRSLLPSKTTTAGYLTINNNRSEAVKLVSAESSTIGAIEFHESTYEDGKHKMEMLNHLEISAEESLKLEPGGYHLMLFDVDTEVTDTHQINFETERGESFSVSFVVQADSEAE